MLVVCEGQLTRVHRKEKKDQVWGLEDKLNNTEHESKWSKHWAPELGPGSRGCQDGESQVYTFHWFLCIQTNVD
jgi:hypothetical protein